MFSIHRSTEWLELAKQLAQNNQGRTAKVELTREVFGDIPKKNVRNKRARDGDSEIEPRVTRSKTK